MIQIQGLWWPDDVQQKFVHAFKHVRSLEWAVRRCVDRARAQGRVPQTAVQAGGNVGLWPRRMAQSFQRVITFEPDAICRECLAVNVPANVEVYPQALGQAVMHCDLQRESLGSHRIIAGAAIPMTRLDDLGLTDVDLLQLDIEGYEWHALDGAQDTIRRCRPVVQVELREFTGRYGKRDQDVRDLLAGFGYREVSRQPGEDVVFEVLA